MRKSFTVSFPEELLNSLDVYCKENSLNRSSALQFCFSQILQQRNSIHAMQGFTEVLQRALASGVLTLTDKDELRSLVDLSNISRRFSDDD